MSEINGDKNEVLHRGLALSGPRGEAVKEQTIQGAAQVLGEFVGQFSLEERNRIRGELGGVLGFTPVVEVRQQGTPEA